MSTRDRIIVAVLALGILAGAVASAFRQGETKKSASSSVETTASDTSAVAVDRTTVETTHADGSRSVERRDVVTRAAAHETAHEVVRVVTVEKKASLPSWRVSALAGVAARPPLVPVSGVPVPLVVGASVERRIVGPVWAGVWADNSVAAGVRVGVEW